MTKSEQTLKAKLAVLILAQPENKLVYMNILESLENVVKEKDEEKQEVVTTIYKKGTHYIGIYNKTGTTAFFYKANCEEIEHEKIPPVCDIITFQA